jgi:hypothetical protein
VFAIPFCIFGLRFSPLNMEDDDLRVQRSTSRNPPHSQPAVKQFGRKSTSAHDRSIDRDEPPIFARKSGVSSPHGTAARKVALSPPRHGPQPVFRSKGMRSNMSSSQNTSMGPPVATINDVRRSTVTNALQRESAELNSSQRMQYPGSQASSLILRTY